MKFQKRRKPESIKKHVVAEKKIRHCAEKDSIHIKRKCKKVDLMLSPLHGELSYGIKGSKRLSLKNL